MRGEPKISDRNYLVDVRPLTHPHHLGTMQELLEVLYLYRLLASDECPTDCKVVRSLNAVRTRVMQMPAQTLRSKALRFLGLGRQPVEFPIRRKIVSSGERLVD
jgi:hypothetical protein